MNMSSGLTTEKNRKNLGMKIYFEGIYFLQKFDNYFLHSCSDNNIPFAR